MKKNEKILDMTPKDNDELKALKEKIINFDFTSENIDEALAEQATELKDILDIDTCFAVKYFVPKKQKYLVGFFKKVDSIKALDKYSFDLTTSPILANVNILKSCMIAGHSELMEEKTMLASGCLAVAQKLVSDMSTEISVF